MTTTADLLNEYGSALRGSWGGIDGRSEEAALSHLAAAIQEHGSSELPAEDIDRLRRHLDVCPYGLGHWTIFCDDDEEHEGNA